MSSVKLAVITVVVGLLTSCQLSQSNFNRQKFTRLKPMNYPVEEKLCSPQGNEVRGIVWEEETITSEDFQIVSVRSEANHDKIQFEYVETEESEVIQSTVFHEAIDVALPPDTTQQERSRGTKKSRAGDIVLGTLKTSMYVMLFGFIASLLVLLFGAIIYNNVSTNSEFKEPVLAFSFATFFHFWFIAASNMIYSLIFLKILKKKDDREIRKTQLILTWIAVVVNIVVIIGVLIPIAFAFLGN